MTQPFEDNFDFYPAKGQFAPGEPITLYLLLPEETGDTVRILCFHLEKCIHEESFPVTAEKTVITLPGFCDTFLGLGLMAEVIKDGKIVKTLFSAADVSRPGRVVRYGFLSGFGSDDMDDDDLESMAKYHINLVQFYDWSYRHDQLVAPSDEYEDMMGKRNSLPCIRQKIKACHDRGMGAMAYGAVYAASKAFFEAHGDWGLYAMPGKPLTFINTFYIMNIEKSSPWRSHIIDQYEKAMEDVGFDGIHMDTYGFPKEAQSEKGRVIRLKEHFPSLIEDTGLKLMKDGINPRLIFNNVGAWPVNQTMMIRQEAVYMEVWPPYERLYQLKELIAQAKPAGKPVVLAAYMAPFRLESEQKALYSALIAAFAIAANGGTQLFLGEENAVLTQGYYADHSFLTAWQAKSIRAYQDFFVRYQELLFDTELEDVTMTHCCFDNLEYRCDTPFSAYGEADKLWLTLREAPNTKLIAMLNLCGNHEDYWNRGKNKPRTLRNITFRIQVNGAVQNVWYATPDEAGGEAVCLPFSLQETDRSEILTVTVPCLEISGLLWLHTAEK